MITCRMTSALNKRIHIYQSMNLCRYKLAHLFGKEGDKIGYLYDFGDKWYHEIEVCRLFSLRRS